MARRGLRVTAGEAKGRLLGLPPHPATRPTSARLREAIFSCLGDINGLSVADLFAGSGALGIEALSRGAASAVFVEASRRVAEVLRRNLERLGYLTRSKVVATNVRRYLGSNPCTFDLVLADPPYEFPGIDRLAPELGERLVAPGGRLVLERSSKKPPPPAGSGLNLALDRAHGDAAFSIYERLRDRPSGQ